MVGDGGQIKLRSKYEVSRVERLAGCGMRNNLTAIEHFQASAFNFGKGTIPVCTALAIALSFSVTTNAQTVTQSGNSANQNRLSAIVYLPDVQLQQLAPQSIIVGANQPVKDAVGRILQAYQGENVGIKGYEVRINPSTHEARINFIIDNPRGAEVFESLSGANQYALFESIRQTLLSQSVYNIEQVTFTANGKAFEI